MPFSLSILKVGPKVRVEPQLVTIQTHWLIAGLTLGLWLDHSEVDSVRKEVRIRRRRFWVFAKSRTIPYASIQFLAYSMIDHGNSLEMERGYAETFDIALTLHTDEEVPLTRYTGNGELIADHSNYHEWISDRVREVTDIRGTQQEDSMDLVELLLRRLGVPLGASRYF